MDRVPILRRVMGPAGVIGSVILEGLIGEQVEPGTPTREQVTEMEEAAREQQAEQAVRREPQIVLEELPGAPTEEVVAQVPRGEVIRARNRRIRDAISSVLGSRTAQTILIGAGAAAVARALRSRAIPAPVSALTPASLIGTQPLPFPQPQVSQPSFLDQCIAEQREKQQKKKKRRKCLRSAPVVWAGGRRKGKIAGRKCLAFSSPR